VVVGVDHLLERRGGGRQVFAVGREELEELRILGQQSEELVQAARDLLQTATKLRQQKDVAGARRALQQAYYFDSVASAYGMSDGETLATASETLQQLRSDQVRSWSKEVPALSNKLDVVLRDVSLADAVKSAAKAAHVKLRLVDGSVDDAVALVSAVGARVDYLDLHGASFAQALDWILLPAGLTWQVQKGEIVVASQRRLAGACAWIYDVSTIALPDMADVVNAQKAADDFLAVARGELNPTNDLDITWYGAGQLLVVGDGKLHARAEKFFASLANAQGRFSGDAEVLHKITSKRAADRRKDVKKRDAESHRVLIADKHVHFGWQLLASAANGQIDMEALTQLQIAWKDAQRT
jgi:hypothetical protein